MRSPEGTWTAAYGVADPKAGTPMTVAMHARIGSITKTFTGTVIMRLVQDHKVSLDDPIEKYVSGVPNGNSITLRQLANMTSGIASYTRSAKFTDTYFAKPETVFTPDELLKVGIAASPLFSPGTQFDYSNTNTILLGMVIEKVTGKPVAEAFDAMVFKPLKLLNTSGPGQSTKMPEPYAEGFTLQGNLAKPDAPSNATFWNPAWGWTAGELISNMDDLLTYGRALGHRPRFTESPTPRKSDFSNLFPGPPATASPSAALMAGSAIPASYQATTPQSIIMPPATSPRWYKTNSDIASGNCARIRRRLPMTRATACAPHLRREYLWP